MRPGQAPTGLLRVALPPRDQVDQVDAIGRRKRGKAGVARQLYADGVSVAEVAAFLGLQPHQVSARIRDRNSVRPRDWFSGRVKLRPGPLRWIP